jgi:hypothetical protein
MPAVRRPFFWKARGCWYVKSADRRNIRLHPEEAIARQMWQQMLRPDGPELPEPGQNGDVVPDQHGVDSAGIIPKVQRLLARIDELAAHQADLRRQIAAAEREAESLRAEAGQMLIQLGELQVERRGLNSASLALG